MIRKISAKGNMVEIISDENGATLIGRREALQRAKAIIGLDKDSQWLVESLVKAANEAKVNDPDDGQPYDSKNLDLLLKTSAEASAKLPG